MWVRIKKLLRDWYQGETKISEPPILAIWADRHWTSRMAHAFIDFHLKEWKWALPFYVALASFFLLFSQKKETKETPARGVPNLTKC